LAETTYSDAVRELLALGGELAAPRQPMAVAKFDLRNIAALADALGAPHRAVPCAHIAGTNGKGSTAAFLASILRRAGLRTGLYTSPHLESINERICVNGQNIPDADFAAVYSQVKTAIESLLAAGTLTAHPTFFEVITAMAFAHFAGGPGGTRCDFAVYEVGLGGRLDSTNIVAPEVCIITQIDFDHENYLGHSIEAIAAEKAGIIKPGVPVVCSAERPEARAVIARRAAELAAPLLHIDDAPSPAPALQVPLAGRFQMRNARTAATSAQLLAQRGFGIPPEAVAEGIAATQWPGRLEKLAWPEATSAGPRPLVYLDGTHNPAGARELAIFWEQELAGKKICLVFGAVRDKAVDEVAGLLFPRAATVILTAPLTTRALSAEALAHVAAHHAERVEVVAAPEAALERALQLAQPGDVVFITGSLYLVGDLRRYWKQRRA